MARALSTGLIVTLVTLVTVGSVLPVFLLGANGPAIMADLDLNAAGFGVAAGAYTCGMASASLTLGRSLDHMNVSRSTILSLLLMAGGGVLASTSQGLAQLAGGLFVSGLASTAVQMSAGRILAGLRGSGHGAAMGWFQSAKPVAVALAGGFSLLAVLGLPWRWTFLLIVGTTASLGAALVRISSELAPTLDRGRRTTRLVGSLLPLSALMASGFALTNISTTFIPDTLATDSSRATWSGALLVVGGTLAAAGRVLAGRLTDRQAIDEVVLVGPAFIAAGVGSLLISTLTTGGILVGSLLVFAIGWVFGGLLIAKGTRLHPDASSAVIGQLLLGGAVGGTVAPPLFGGAATSWGYDTAWVIWGLVILAIGAACIWQARRGVSLRP